MQESCIFHLAVGPTSDVAHPAPSSQSAAFSTYSPNGLPLFINQSSFPFLHETQGPGCHTALGGLLTPRGG